MGVFEVLSAWSPACHFEEDEVISPAQRGNYAEGLRLESVCACPVLS
jgi:hypothetical protein